MSAEDVVRRVSTCIFYTPDKKILLQDRKGISKFGEEWSAFGGSIEEGETPKQAVIREIQEELEYELKEFIFLKDFTDPKPSGGGFATEYMHLAKFPGFDALNQIEGENMKLFTLDETKKLKILPSYKRILEEVELFLNNLH